MATYAVTGAASGMGKEVAEQLRAAGHAVITVDLHDADVIADLSTATGRAKGAADVLAIVGGRLDGAVLAAGIGPAPGRERMLAEINYFGVVDLLTAWRPALAAAGSSKVVIFSSNSTSTTPLVPGRAVKALVKGDVDAFVRAFRIFGANGAGLAYGGSKIALTRWMRRIAVTRDWAGAGIRVNAIAPGAILTPLLQAQLDDPALAGAIESFPIPIGGYGSAEGIAAWVVVMLSPAADFMVGSLVVVDGGTDALFRANDWPKAVPLSGLRRYLATTKAFNAAKAARAGSA